LIDGDGSVYCEVETQFERKGATCVGLSQSLTDI